MIPTHLTFIINFTINVRRGSTIFRILRVPKNYTNAIINSPNKGIGSCALDLALAIRHTIHILASKPLETIWTNMFNNTTMVVKVRDLD